MLHSTVLQWPCNAIRYAGPSGQLLYTITFYLVLKGPAQHFFSWPVVKNIGTEWWWLCLYSWRSLAHTSVPCIALSLTSWPDRATSTRNFMNHALWTHTVQHVFYRVAGFLDCSRPMLFVLHSSAIIQLKILQTEMQYFEPQDAVYLKHCGALENSS